MVMCMEYVGMCVWNDRKEIFFPLRFRLECPLQPFSFTEPLFNNFTDVKTVYTCLLFLSTFLNFSESESVQFFYKSEVDYNKSSEGLV